MPELRRTTLDVVDIADDAALLSRFGETIPVVCDGAGRSIAWPFNADDIVEWLA